MYKVAAKLARRRHRPWQCAGGVSFSGLLVFRAANSMRVQYVAADYTGLALQRQTMRQSTSSTLHAQMTGQEAQLLHRQTCRFPWNHQKHLHVTQCQQHHNSNCAGASSNAWCTPRTHPYQCFGMEDTCVGSVTGLTMYIENGMQQHMSMLLTDGVQECPNTLSACSAGLTGSS